MENIIEFRNVCKHYGKQAVLQDLSFEIGLNDFVGLVGNNGCGKTTTINLMCNILKYDSGQIIAFDKIVNERYVDYKAKLGVVLSKPYYIEDFTVIEHLFFVARFQNVKSELINERVSDVINLLDLGGYSGKVIKELSTGNQVKVSLASALIHNPDLLILDEPFANLDISSSENLLKILKSLKKNKTLLITSHNLDLVISICDKFLIMDNGKIVMSLLTSDFQSKEDLKEFVKNTLTRGCKNHNVDWLLPE